MRTKIINVDIVACFLTYILTSCNKTENNKKSEKELQKRELDLKQKELELREKELAIDSIQKSNTIVINLSSANQNQSQNKIISTQIKNDQSIHDKFIEKWVFNGDGYNCAL